MMFFSVFSKQASWLAVFGVYLFSGMIQEAFFFVGILKIAHANGDPVLNQFH